MSISLADPAPMAMNSASVFAATVKDLELEEMNEKFKSKGIKCLADFAFVTDDVTGKDPTAFEKVMAEMLDSSTEHLKVRMRRLYAMAFQAFQLGVVDAIEPKDASVKVPMHLADRTQRTADLQKRITTFKLEGPNMPSTQLTDKMHTILAKGHVP